MACTELLSAWSHLRIKLAAALLLLGADVVSAQRDSAATESEWTDGSSALLRGDVHRDGDLAILHPRGSLHGAQHLSQFLAAWDGLLFGAPRSAVDGPLEIVHFGGSHVQAGRIGWSFRNRLGEDRPGIVTGCGIQAPHRLVKSNGPPERGWSSPAEWKGQSCANRRHRAHWGITGVEARAAIPAPVSCWSGAPAGERCVSEIRILAAPDTLCSWRPQLPAEWTTKASALHTGIAQWRSPDGVTAPDTLTLMPNGVAAPSLHGVEWVPQGVDLVFHDLGANGANATSWMRNPLFVPQLRSMAPDLVILAWGINDAHMAPNRFDALRFKRHYDALIDTIRQAHPLAEILLVTNNDSHYRHRHNPNAEAVREAMLAMVDDRAVACWDLYGHMGGKDAIDALYHAGFAASDRLHFRKDGYVLIGEMLYELLVRAAIDQRPHTP